MHSRFQEPEGAIRTSRMQGAPARTAAGAGPAVPVSPEVVQWEFLRQQERSLRLKKLFDHIQAHSEQRLSVAEAARLVAMSPPQFMKTFKRVAGMTLVAYLNHRAPVERPVLRETSLTIAEIASAVGFAGPELLRTSASNGPSARPPANSAWADPVKIVRDPPTPPRQGRSGWEMLRPCTVGFP